MFPAGVRIFAGTAAVAHSLTVAGVMIAAEKPAAEARPRSALLWQMMILAEIFPASSEQASLAAQC